MSRAGENPASRSVLTLGETMALLDPIDEGPFASGTRFQLRIGGAESNFAIALSRLGIPVTWISRLGQDPFGDVILDTLQREGVDVARVLRDPVGPTGVFFKWRRDGRSHNAYYRRGSAASRLGLSDITDDVLAGVGLLHLTGITTGISERSRTLVVELARRAHSRGVVTMFDINYRSALWESPRAAGEACREVLAFVDWCLCGLEEGNVVFGTSDPDELVEAITGVGAGGAVIRLGAQGALVWHDGRLETVAPALVEHVVDEVGAGDAFAAGFAWGLLHSWSPASCARAGNLLAAFALRGTGDWETVPRLSAIEADLLACAAGSVPS